MLYIGDADTLVRHKNIGFHRWLLSSQSINLKRGFQRINTILTELVYLAIKLFLSTFFTTIIDVKNQSDSTGVDS